MSGDVAWNQPSPGALVLGSSSFHPLFVRVHCSHFTGALPLLSPLDLPSGQIMPMTFNASLNTALSSSQLLSRELLHVTRQGTKCPLCCQSRDRQGSMQLCLFYSAMLVPILWPI